MTAQTESKEKKVGLDFLDDATLRRIAKDDIDPDFYEEDGDKVPSEEAHFAIVLLAKRSCGLEGLTDEDLAQIVNGYPHTEQGELTPGARLAFAELLRRSGRGASGS